MPQSLQDQINEIHRAWDTAIGVSVSSPVSVNSWVSEVFPDNEVVIYEGDTYFRLGFTETDGEIEFASRDTWVEVERETKWVTKSIQMLVERTGKNPIKSISTSKSEHRVGNYIVLYGDDKHRDLEHLRSGPNADGSKGEYFTKHTALESSFTETGVLHLDWEHGLGKQLDNVGPGKDEMIGRVDWKTAVSDDIGVWVERVISRKGKYSEALEILINEGIVGSSSQATPESIKVKSNGEIEVWPLERDTFTVSPAEPRMLTDNVVAAFKSLGLEVPELEPRSEGAKPAPTQAKAKGKKRPAQKNIYQSNKRSIKTMFKTKLEALKNYAEINGFEVDDLNEAQKTFALKGTEWEIEETLGASAIKTMVDDGVKAGIEKFKKGLPATNGDPGKGDPNVVLDEADQPFETEGDFFMAVKGAAISPHKTDVRLKSRKAGLGLNESEPDAGGFLVGSQVKEGIAQRMHQIGELFRRVALDPISGNNNGMTYNRVDETSRADGSRQGGIQGYWVAEGGTLTSIRPKFDQLELKLKKVAALAYATDEQLQDAATLESWLNREVPLELTFKVEDAIFNGDGVGKPLGIMQGGALVTVTRVDANQIDATDVSNMWARRWAGLGSNYVWLAEQSINPQLQVMTIADQPIYQPPGAFKDAPLATLFGRPVIETEYNAALGTTGDLMLVDLSQYQAIDKGGVKSASSMHVQFVTDEMAFRFIKRVDGAPFWKSALTPKSGADNRSPYVVLSADSS